MNLPSITYKVVIASANITKELSITCLAMDIRSKVTKLWKRNGAKRHTYYNVYKTDHHGHEVFCFSIYWRPTL